MALTLERECDPETETQTSCEVGEVKAMKKWTKMFLLEFEPTISTFPQLDVME